MKINNVLKSLSWNSLLRAARKSSLRRSRTNWSLSALVAVDVLEPRSMLSGPTANVTAAVSGPNIVLSSDNTGNHSINVFRLNATTVEVDAVAGTVNGKSSVLLNISTVTGITVNLGNAYDTYNIYSKSGSPALNVGIGGITFQGAGGTGNDLRVHNDSANAMSIIGNVTVQGTTVGSWLTQSGSSSSYFGLYTNSTGSLTLQNNVSVALKATGTENISSEIYTGAAGNLSILGAVTQKQTLTTGVGENGIFSGGTGNLTIAYGIQQSQVGLAPGSSNFVSVGYAGSDFESYPTSASSGSVSIAHIGIAQSSNNTVFNQNLVTLVSGTTSSMTVYGTVTQTATTAALDLNGPIITDFPSDAANVISNDTGGALTIGGNVAQNSSGYFGNNLIELYAAGNIAIQGTVTQTNTSSSSANNFVGVSGNGTLSVSASLTQSATSAGGAFNLLSSQYSEAGKVSIVTTVTQNASTGLSFSALALEGFATQND
ncbi:MAG: hypothetical protein JSS02_35375, partial [Planctomycetes bacterium]|nr:hypothetical protein [Planctomycetota bacterium]